MPLEILLTASLICMMPGLALLGLAAGMQGRSPQLAPQTHRKATSTRRAA